MQFFFVFLSDLGSNRAGELDHGDPLGVRRSSGSAAPQGRHGAPAANRNPQVGAEDRHGREDEEDGRHAAVHGHRRQEEEDHSGAGRKQGQCIRCTGKGTGETQAPPTDPSKVQSSFQTFCSFKSYRYLADSLTAFLSDTVLNASAAPSEGFRQLCSKCLADSQEENYCTYCTVLLYGILFLHMSLIF